MVISEQYIGNTGDMVALKAGRDDAWLDRRIFQLLCRLDSAPIRVSSRGASSCNLDILLKYFPAVGILKQGMKLAGSK